MYSFRVKKQLSGDSTGACFNSLLLHRNCHVYAPPQKGPPGGHCGACSRLFSPSFLIRVRALFSPAETSALFNPKSRIAQPHRFSQAPLPRLSFKSVSPQFPSLPPFTFPRPPTNRTQCQLPATPGSNPPPLSTAAAAPTTHFTCACSSLPFVGRFTGCLGPIRAPTPASFPSNTNAGGLREKHAFNSRRRALLFLNCAALRFSLGSETVRPLCAPLAPGTPCPLSAQYAHL